MHLYQDYHNSDNDVYAFKGNLSLIYSRSQPHDIKELWVILINRDLRGLE